MKSNGKVVTWGAAPDGGDCSAVQQELEADVQEVYSTNVAFAAVKSDGKVVTWGDEGRGGDCSAVRQELDA